MDSYPGTVVHPGRPRGARQLAGDVNPAERARYMALRRAGERGGARRREHVQHRAARRLRLRPDRRQPHRAEGLLRPLLLQLGRHAGRPREPGRQRAPALPVPRRRTATACSTARRSSDCSARRRAARGFVDVDDNIERPYSQEISAHLEREIVSGLSGRFSYVYKKVRNEWVEIDPTREAAMTIPFTFIDIGADGVGWHRRRPDRWTCWIVRRARRRRASSPTRPIRPTTATSRPSSSPSTAASPASGWC